MVNTIIFYKKNNFFNFIKKKKIFLLTGNRSFNESGFAYDLRKSQIDKTYIEVYFKREKFPQYIELKNILKRLNNYNPDLIIGVGGGSVLDYAKLAFFNLRTKNFKKNIFKKKQKINKIKTRLVLVPTTAGSGAENTSFSVLYKNKKKFSITNNIMKPSFIFYNFKYVMRSNKYIRATSAFDSLSQLIESFFAKNSTSKSLNYSIQGMKIALENINSYVAKPNALNTKKMIKAASLSGKAINISKTGGPHACSYPFSSLLNISHGQSVSFTFSNFLLFNFFGIFKLDKTVGNQLISKYNALFKLTNAKTIFDLILFFNELIKSLGLKKNITQVKRFVRYNKKKIIKLVDKNRLSNNPISFSNKELVTKIFKI
jgi:alcohol dehydrogenase class IV